MWKVIHGLQVKIKEGGKKVCILLAGVVKIAKFSKLHLLKVM